MTLRFGIDVGGTFTDVVCLRDGNLVRGKADTTHYDLKVGFFNAARIAAEKAGLTLDTPVLAREQMTLGATIDGPAVVEGPDTTYAVRPGWRLSIDAFGSLTMTRHPGV
jgi:N-methylhydantoinase A